MKLRRFFHLRRVAHAGEFHQRRLWNQLGDLLAEHLIVADFRLDLGGREVLADGGGVGGADQQQGRHLQVFELVVHRLGEGSGDVGFIYFPC